MEKEAIISTRKEIGRCFNLLRKRANISEAELSRQTGVTQKVIIAIEKGHTNYTIDSYIALMGELNVRIEKGNTHKINNDPLKAIKVYSLSKKCDAIETVVSDFFDMPKELMKNKSRRAEYVIPRFICFKLEEEFAGASKGIIASRFDKNRASVYNGISTLNNLIETNHKWGKVYLKIYGIIYEKFNLKATYQWS